MWCALRTGLCKVMERADNRSARFLFAGRGTQGPARPLYPHARGSYPLDSLLRSDFSFTDSSFSHETKRSKHFCRQNKNKKRRRRKNFSSLPFFLFSRMLCIRQAAKPPCPRKATCLPCCIGKLFVKFDMKYPINGSRDNVPDGAWVIPRQNPFTAH